MIPVVWYCGRFIYNDNYFTHVIQGGFAYALLSDSVKRGSPMWKPIVAVIFTTAYLAYGYLGSKNISLNEVFLKYTSNSEQETRKA